MIWHPFVIERVKVSGMGLLHFKTHSHDLSLCLRHLVRTLDEYILLLQNLFLQNLLIMVASENYQSPLRKLTFLHCFWKLLQQWGQITSLCSHNSLKMTCNALHNSCIKHCVCVKLYFAMPTEKMVKTCTLWNHLYSSFSNWMLWTFIPVMVALSVLLTLSVTVKKVCTARQKQEWSEGQDPDWQINLRVTEPAHAHISHLPIIVNIPLHILATFWL